METLRILAMLGILVVHSDFFALGAPSADECTTSPLTSFWRFSIESFTIVSVNLFVLISGWFGIHPKRVRLLEFLFQILFFNVFLFCVFSIIMPERTLTRAGIESILMLDDRFWFVKAYLMLYFLSPVLNKFVCLSTKEQTYILLGFFIFQSVYGWLYPSVSWFRLGYSTMSFIGLYFLAQYYRNTVPLNLGGKSLIVKRLFLFVVLTLLNTLIAYECMKHGKGHYMDMIYAYNSPLVIVSSLSLFLVFTKLHFQNQSINYIAISSFAAFLFHANYFFLRYVFVPTLQTWHNNDSLFLFSLKTVSFIVILFIVAVFIDKIRILVWRRFIESKLISIFLNKHK